MAKDASTEEAPIVRTPQLRPWFPEPTPKRQTLTDEKADLRPPHEPAHLIWRIPWVIFRYTAEMFAVAALAAGCGWLVYRSVATVLTGQASVWYTPILLIFAVMIGYVCLLLIIGSYECLARAWDTTSRHIVSIAWFSGDWRRASLTYVAFISLLVFLAGALIWAMLSVPGYWILAFTPLAYSWGLFGLLALVSTLARLTRSMRDGHRHDMIETPHDQPETAGDVQGLRIAHLSDLHLVDSPNAKTLEKETGPNSKAEKWLPGAISLSSVDVLLVTGDVCDYGSAAQWREFYRLFEPHMNKLVLVPGNHDVCLSNSIYHIERGDRFRTRVRMTRMILALNEIQGNRAFVITPDADVPLSELVGRHVEDLKNFIEDTPLRRFEMKQKGGGDYEEMEVPNEETNRILELPETLFGKLFPMYFELKHNCVLTVLNSTIAATGISDNAIGTISADQLKNLQLVLEKFPERTHLIALHHHVALPRQGGWKDRFMTLTNATKLIDLLDTFGSRPTLVFHGHRHIRYSGILRGLRILSASATFLGGTAFENHKSSRCEPGYYIWTVSPAADRSPTVQGSWYNMS